jgi:hypothetical protein
MLFVNCATCVEFFAACLARASSDLDAFFSAAFRPIGGVTKEELPLF